MLAVALTKIALILTLTGCDPLARAQAGRPRPYEWVLEVAHGLAAAQLAAHNLGIVHMDVKHDNVVIDDAALAAVASFYVPPL